ncbi:MAG: hypothetical protein GF335_03230 [Candidatus Moranbacteria bacterium]|nr:hypothetical protein [Candidatus Moranbacteria bacterium]
MIKAIPFFIKSITLNISAWSVELLYFWLIKAPVNFWRIALRMNLAFESQWATYITFRNLFAPLYQDYSIIGRIIGPIFRIIRIFFGLICHLILFITEIIAFAVFCLIFEAAPVWFIVNLFIWNQ